MGTIRVTDWLETPTVGVDFCVALASKKISNESLGLTADASTEGLLGMGGTVLPDGTAEQYVGVSIGGCS